MKRKHSFSEIFPLIQAISNSVEVTLIGGQALNYWGEIYLQTTDKTYLASEDIDFLGSREDIKKCAKIWDGVLKVEQVFKMIAKKKIYPRIIDEHDIDLFDSTPLDARLGEKFIKRRYSQMLKLLANLKI